MARPNPRTIVAMEILVKRDQIVPMGICPKQVHAAVHGPPPIPNVPDASETTAELIRDAAAATDTDEDRARTLLPLVATLAMAALGRHLREPSPEIPWFGTDPRDHFDEPLLDALTALFEQDEDSSKRRR